VKSLQRAINHQQQAKEKGSRVKNQDDGPGGVLMIQTPESGPIMTLIDGYD
jgi:hypothetical protein